MSGWLCQDDVGLRKQKTPRGICSKASDLAWLNYIPSTCANKFEFSQKFYMH